MAQSKDRQRKEPAIRFPGVEERVGFWRSPTVGHCLLHGVGQAAEKVMIVRQGQAFADFPPLDGGISGPGFQMIDQGITGLEAPLNMISRLAQAIQQGHCASRRIQSDAIAQSGILIGIIGKDDRDPSIRCRGSPQAQPLACQVCDELTAIRNRIIGDYIGLGQRIPFGAALEADSATQQATIHFR